MLSLVAKNSPVQRKIKLVLLKYELRLVGVVVSFMSMVLSSFWLDEPISSRGVTGDCWTPVSWEPETNVALVISVKWFIAENQHIFVATLILPIYGLNCRIFSKFEGDFVLKEVNSV